LQESSSILASPMSTFFSMPVRAIYAARAEQQAVEEGVQTAGSEGTRLPASMPDASVAPAATAAESLGLSSAAANAPSTNGSTAPAGGKQQNSSTAVSSGTALLQPQTDAPPPQQQQQQQQHPQQRRTQPPRKQEQRSEQLAAITQLGTPVPVSASNNAKKNLNAAALAASDTAHAAMAAVSSLKILKPKPAPALYTPMLPST
jgi:hypothetical protein